MKIAAGILLSLFALSGCASISADRASLAKRAKTEMIGMSKMELLLCAGVPDLIQKMDGMEFLAYNRRWISGGRYLIHSHSCEATFVLVDDVVERVSYIGKTDGYLSNDRQCGYIIQDCIPDK